MNVVKRIAKANLGRDRERLDLKYRAMRQDPFAFFRGSCHLFYDRLAECEMSTSAPRVWCCGDLHLENFGSYKGDNRLVYFDINDFDEAALAPATWEIVRFATSVLTACKADAMSSVQALAFAGHFVHSYASALALGKARWLERDTAGGVAGELLNQLRARRRVDFLNGRTRIKGRSRRFRNDGVKTLPVSDTERAAVLGFMENFAKSRNHSFYRVIDVARRVAGTGSLGLSRYAILVEGKGSPDQNYLLDLKLAQQSSLASCFPGLQPAWESEAQRVVSLQRRIQAVPMAFLESASFAGQSYVLRELQPVEDRLPTARFRNHPDLFAETMTVMGHCLAWAHLRSSGRQGSAIADELIAFGEKKKWRRTLLQSASDMSVQAHADWQSFCTAYDKGKFRADA